MDTVFVEHLKQKLKKDPTAPGVYKHFDMLGAVSIIIHYLAIGAPPLAVLCVGVKSPSEYQHKYTDVYKYEVLGGLHSITARKDILNDSPGT